MSKSKKQEIKGINRKKKFIVTSIEEGFRVIKHKDITANWKKSLRVRPKNRIAVLVPCAATKPFSESPSHKYGYLRALEGKDVDVYIVSEPLGIVPYSWQKKYPNADYDYPPKFLRGKAWKLLAERMGEWFDRIYPKYDRVYSALPGHHQKLVKDAIEQSEEDVKLKSVTISDFRKVSGQTNIFRASSRDYVSFLKDRIK